MHSSRDLRLQTLKCWVMDHAVQQVGSVALISDSNNEAESLKELKDSSKLNLGKEDRSLPHLRCRKKLVMG